MSMTSPTPGERRRWSLWLSVVVVATSLLCVLALLVALGVPTFYLWKALPRIVSDYGVESRLYGALVLGVTCASFSAGIGILIAWLDIIRRLPTHRRAPRARQVRPIVASRRNRLPLARLRGSGHHEPDCSTVGRRRS